MNGSPRAEDVLASPPAGYVPLSALAGALGRKPDSLSRYARFAMVPGAVRALAMPRQVGLPAGRPSWFLPSDVAAKLEADHGAGLPLPWDGQPMPDLLTSAYRLWCVRKHPRCCATCQRIWGGLGQPAGFDAYASRYPALSRSEKAHLTKLWPKARLLSDIAEQLASECEGGADRVVEAVENGALRVEQRDGAPCVEPAVLDGWIRAGRPVAPPGADPVWVLPGSAAASAGLDHAELLRQIEEGSVETRLGTMPTGRGRLFVAQQAAEVRAGRPADVVAA